MEDHPILLGELATKLARPEGRETPDPGERWNILRASWMLVEREDFFAQDDVLMRNAAGEFELFLPALRAVCEGEAREDRAAKVDDFDAGVSGPAIRHSDPDLIEALEKMSEVPWVRVHINAAAIFLRRTAARRYLESCGLEGALRVLREWFGAAEAAIPETAQLKASSPRNGRRGKTGPEPKLRTAIANRMLDDLRSERRAPEELLGDTLAALASQYGGSPNTANAARRDALARFSALNY